MKLNLTDLWDFEINELLKFEYLTVFECLFHKHINFYFFNVNYQNPFLIDISSIFTSKYP